MGESSKEEEKRETQNEETGFLGIRMVELNRHFGSGK